MHHCILLPTASRRIYHTHRKKETSQTHYRLAQVRYPPMVQGNPPAPSGRTRDTTHRRQRYHLHRKHKERNKRGSGAPRSNRGHPVPSCGTGPTTTQHQATAPHMSDQHRRSPSKTADPSLRQGYHNGSSVGSNMRRTTEPGILDTPGFLPQPTSRGSHGVETSRRVIGHHHESGPVDFPHLHDLHPCPNWGTRQGIGMENV